MIGVDSYDQWPSVASAGGWKKQLNGEQGLSYWLAFAKAHGKKLSVPEWGSIRYGRSAGRDDPQYIRDMRAFFAANAAHIAFEAIFQGSIGNYNAGHTMPKAAQVYKAGFLSARHSPGHGHRPDPRADRKARSNGRTAPPSRWNQPGQRHDQGAACIRGSCRRAAASTATPVVPSAWALCRSPASDKHRLTRQPPSASCAGARRRWPRSDAAARPGSWTRAGT